MAMFARSRSLGRTILYGAAIAACVVLIGQMFYSGQDVAVDLSQNPPTVKLTVMSDIHLGGPWLKTPKRQKLLMDFLTKRMASTSNDLLLLGDVYDTWVHVSTAAPPTTMEVMTSSSMYGMNIAAFNKALMDLSTSRSITYVHGNHDDTVTAADFNSVFNGTVTYESTVYSANGIHGEHGHMYDLFNEPNGNGLMRPFGYFVSRAGAVSDASPDSGGDTVGRTLAAIASLMPDFMEKVDNIVICILYVAVNINLLTLLLNVCRRLRFT